MPTVELVYEQAGAPPGAVVGAVEIVDDRLVTVAGAVVRSRQGVPVDLPAGRYFAQGWLPSGDRIAATFEAPGRPAVLRGTGTRPADPVPEADGWALGWRYAGGGWTADVAARLSAYGAAGVDVTLAPVGGSSSLAVQVGGPGAAAHIAVAPPGVPLRLRPAPPAWRVLLAPSIEATLLEYLHRGDTPAARIVAAEALAHAEDPGDSGSPLLDIAIGYHLLGCGHPAADDWIPALAWTQPDSVDVLVLNACHRARTGEPVAEELVRAAGNGLPVVAAGVRLLEAGLSAVGADAVPIRRYLAAQVDGPLTAFAGTDPGRPTRRPQPWDREPPPRAVRFVVTRPAPEPVPVGPTPPELTEALHRLQARGVGTGPQREEVRVGTLTLAATVTDSAAPALLDVELSAPAAGTTVSLRVGPTLHCLGTFDERGRCAIRRVPPGSWVFSVREPPRQARLRARSVPLPLPTAELALAASGTDSTEEILRAVTPGGRTLLVLRRQASGRYQLEAVRAPGEEPALLGVEYTRAGGDPAVRLMPVQHSSATVGLDGFDVRGPWQVAEDLGDADVAGLSLDDLVASVRDAASMRTRRAWRSLAADLPPAARLAVERQLAEGSDA